MAEDVDLDTESRWSPGWGDLPQRRDQLGDLLQLEREV
jgi:hypothetical protein